MRRWLRCLVCLLVICALLINLSPLRVKATGVTAGGVVVGVGITIAVAAALNALGVRQGSDSSSFSEIVNSCAEALSPKFATDGLVTFLSLTLNGVGKTYASANFLQAILDFLFAEDVLDSTSFEAYSSGFTATDHFGTGTIFESDAPFYVGYIYETYTYGFNNVREFVIPTTSNVTMRYSSGNLIWTLEAASGAREWLSANSQESSKSWTIPFYGTFNTKNAFYDFMNSFGSDSITTTQDLTLESVGQDVDTDYKTYVDTGIVDIEWGVHFEENGDGSDDDNGGGMVGVPVRIPDLSTDSFTDQTQEEAQTGNTPQEILDQLLQQLGGGGSGSGTGDGTGSGNTGNTGNTWVPPSSHTQFALADLSKYFPFCIPFDLFDFFTLLDADPVAPVLSWEIQDLSGQTYALSVNLSEWDSVAQLFRRLQLFLFICGLAAASRKYIKW